MMAQHPQPLALTPALPSSLLTYILTHQCHPTTLLICQSRANFLLSLQRCMPNIVQRQPPLYVEPSSAVPHVRDEQNRHPRDGDEGDIQAEERREEDGGKERHPLLIATLHQILTSRYINLVFVPTLSHLRAYLAIFPSPFSSSDKPKAGEGPPEQIFEKKGNRTPLLVVYGLVAMHRDTSEWSAQGLASSVADLVEAGQRVGRGVVMVEEREWDAEVNGEEGTERMTGWEERVPMLNGSVKRVGLEGEDGGGWSGRTVEVGRVLGRWFRFERGEWDEDV